MKKTKSLILIVVSFSLIFIICNNFFLKSMIVGTYVNNNYDQRVSGPEVPYEQDTLILFDNNKFTSPFWGNGTYQIIYGLYGTEIKLSYALGKSYFRGRLTRLWLGKPKIILDQDLNYYFEKK